MPNFARIKDCSDRHLVLNTLVEVGRYYLTRVRQAHSQSLQETEGEQPVTPSELQPVVSIASPLHESEYESAVNVLHPLAFYAQRKASEEWKVQLGDDLANSRDPDIIECLYEGLLAPYLQGERHFVAICSYVDEYTSFLYIEHLHVTSTGGTRDARVAIWCTS